MSVRGEKLLIDDIMNDHSLGVQTRERNTLDFILTSLPCPFQDINSPDKLSYHDVISGTIPPTKRPQRIVNQYQKGDDESMKKRCVRICKRNKI